MKLEGKTIAFLGDSITEGVGVANRADNRFDNVIKKKANLRAVYNYGVGGTRIAHQIHPSNKPRHDLCFCGRAYDLKKDADIIVVFGGTNDYGHGDAPIGCEEDTTPATFYGGVHFLMNFLKTTYPDATLIFMTPAHRKGDGAPAKNYHKLPDALPLSAYVDIIKAKAEQFDIPVLDLYENLGIDPNDESDREKYTMDGLHFNDEGHKMIAEKLIDFLNQL